MTFLLPVGRYVWPSSVPVRYAVCSVSSKVSPNLISDGRAIAAWHKRGHGHAREGR